VSLGRIEDFALERYFARWEFSVDHQLSASDVEPFTLSELLKLADDDSRARWERLSLGYTESAGLPALRAEIANLYPGMPPEHVLVAAGAEEAILLTMLATLQPGDEMIVVTPAYQSLRSVPESLGAKVVEVRLRAEDGWVLDADAVARARTSRTRMIAVNFPHNPTGSHIDAATLRRLVEIADDAGAMLFSDEVYRGLEYRDGDRLPPAATLSPSAVSLGVMSKSFALAGLRIGWLATRNASLLDRVAKLKDYTTICSSAPSEILALMALRQRDAVLARSRAIVAENLDVARQFVTEHQSAVEWTPPRAGSVAFPRFRRLDADVVSERLAKERSALLMPGSVFGADARQFRIGLGRRDLPQALAALARAISRA
jgi:aspartate/methionine/tyrosine aminotransferase